MDCVIINKYVYLQLAVVSSVKSLTLKLFLKLGNDPFIDLIEAWVRQTQCCSLVCIVVQYCTCHNANYSNTTKQLIHAKESTNVLVNLGCNMQRKTIIKKMDT